MKNIVITGSTRGIGYGMAQAFLSLGCAVMVSGRTSEAVEHAVAQLRNEFPAGKLGGYACDVSEAGQVQMLWEATVALFGQVDIWVNNAGLGNPTAPLWEQDPERLKAIVNTNVLGVMNGARVALREMQQQKSFGAIYNMEGFGSNGRTMVGFTPYGSTKYAVHYINQSLAKEAEGTGMIVGAISPGMVVTDLLLVDAKNDPQRFEGQKRIFNILADRVETVTPFLARKMLENTKNGARIKWLSTSKIMFRFLTARFHKRALFSEL